MYALSRRGLRRAAGADHRRAGLHRLATWRAGWSSWTPQVTLVDSLMPALWRQPVQHRGIEDRVRVNIADVRDPNSMDYLVQGQDFIFNLAGQVSHIDSHARPVHRPGHQLPQPAVDAGSVPPAQPAASRSSSPARASMYGKPDYLPVDEHHLMHPTDVNGINKMAGEWYHILYNNVYGVRALAAPDQHLRAAPVDARCSPGLHRLVRAPGRGERARSPSTARHPDPRLQLRGRCGGCLPARRRTSEAPNGEVFNLGGTPIDAARSGQAADRDCGAAGHTG